MLTEGLFHTVKDNCKMVKHKSNTANTMVTLTKKVYHNCIKGEKT